MHWVCDWGDKMIDYPIFNVFITSASSSYSGEISKSSQTFLKGEGDCEYRSCCCCWEEDHLVYEVEFLGYEVYIKLNYDYYYASIFSDNSAFPRWRIAANIENIVYCSCYLKFIDRNAFLTSRSNFASGMFLISKQPVLLR